MELMNYELIHVYFKHTFAFYVHDLNFKKFKVNFSWAWKQNLET